MSYAKGAGLCPPPRGGARGQRQWWFGVLRRCTFATATVALAATLLALPDRADAAPGDWTLTKTANPTTFTGAGQVITYTYVITDHSGGSGFITNIIDDKATITDCVASSDPLTATHVPASGTTTCHGTYTTTAADVTAGSVTNHAEFDGDSCSDGCNVSATASATITLQAQPSWTLTKTPNPTTYTGAGQTISYSYTLTNTGNVAISAITVSDNKVATVTCNATTLAVGANTTCSGSYQTTAADVTAGRVTNTATAHGTPAGGTLTDATASATVTNAAPPSGSITIIKSATGGNATFNFTSTIAGATSFTLTTVGGAATRVFSGVTPGSYTFTEVNLPLSWNLSGLTCVGDTGGRPTTVNLSGRSVTIGLDGGEAITCTFANAFDITGHISTTKQEIARFLDHRISLLADHEPDRNRFIRRVPGVLWGEPGPGGFGGGAGGPFTVSGSTAGLSTQFAFATSLSQIAAANSESAERDAKSGRSAMAMAGKGSRHSQDSAWYGIDPWVEAHFSETRADTGLTGTRGHFGIVYVGADYLVTPAVLVGALAQFDWLSENITNNSSKFASGHGWMAGPYVSARLLQNLFFDARAAWGTSTNQINPFGTYTDGFETDRWLAHAQFTGNWHNKNFRVTPSLGFTYVAENQHSYTDSLGFGIPAQTVALGRLSFGPEFAYRWKGSNDTVYEPQLSITGQWDLIKPDGGSIGGVPVLTDDFHARLEAGVMIHSPRGVSMRAVGSYDGLGSSRVSDFGGRLWLNFPLH